MYFSASKQNFQRKWVRSAGISQKEAGGGGEGGGGLGGGGKGEGGKRWVGWGEEAKENSQKDAIKIRTQKLH
jgi:hypothetical protein